MSRIDKLIEQLFPNGVEIKELGEIVKSIKTGLNPRQNFTLNTGDAKNYYVTVKEITTGEIKFSSKTDRINDDAIKIISNRSELEIGDVLFSGIGTIGKIALVDIPTNNWNVSESVFLIKPIKNIVISKFLMYILTSNQIKEQYEGQSVGSTLKGLRKGALSQLKIPLPPLAIQQEIVNILDKFTALDAELQSELEARKKQYEYYRNQLLNFEGKEVEWKTLGEVCCIFDGTHQTPKYVAKGIKFVSVENIKDLYASKKYITIDDFENLYRIKPQLNDVFMTRIGTIGACAIIDRNEPLSFYVTLTLLRPNQDIVKSKFVKYYIESSIGQKELRKRTLVNAVPIKINLGEIGKIRFPIPSLSVQESIISTLDKFEELVNSVLPAEIAVRRNQYEYYREKLLTFNKVEQIA